VKGMTVPSVVSPHEEVPTRAANLDLRLEPYDSSSLPLEAPTLAANLDLRLEPYDSSLD
jgi:hypothetical protein